MKLCPATVRRNAEALLKLRRVFCKALVKTGFLLLQRGQSLIKTIVQPRPLASLVAAEDAAAASSGMVEMDVPLLSLPDMPGIAAAGDTGSVGSIEAGAAGMLQVNTGA